MTSLWPKYISIKRGVIITTVTAGWIMVPWKIISSASSLLNFMGALGVLLAPIAAILAGDYWIVKRRAVDVPALYRKRGRYNYGNAAGTNWRAAIAMLVGTAPNLPGMAAAVNPDLDIGGASKIYAMFYLYGFTSTFVVYCAQSLIWPARDTLIEKTVTEETIVVDGVQIINDGVQDPQVAKLADVYEETKPVGV
jgi:nucleobase:cation symporter-1, NCS1 family